MFVRDMALKLGLVGAVGVLAFFAFLSTASAPRAEAVHVHPVCTFEIPLRELIQQGGGADTVTCVFTLRGVEHTLVVDFTIDLAARPPLTIDGCTLNGNTIHRGPCP